MIIRFILASVFSSILILTIQDLKAQPSLSMHLDAGKNNVSEGLFVKTAGFGQLGFGKNIVRGGVQFDLLGPSTKLVTATTLTAGREFSIKEFPFEIRAIYGYNSFSELLYEYKLGLMAHISPGNFTIGIGNSFRTYGFTKYAAEEYSIDRANKIRENWNLIYLLSYSLKPAGHKWDVSLSLTNIDHFIIEQETNPVIFLRGEYKVSKPLTLFAESWYKTAGSFNLSINHFGFFFRTGIVWDIEL